MAQGIDRARLHVYDVAGGHLPLPVLDKQSRSYSELVGGDLENLEEGRPRTSPHIHRSSKVTRMKLKAKKVFGISSSSLIEHEPSKAPILAPKPEEASESERLIKDMPQRDKFPVKDMISNPKETIQSMARGSGGEQLAQAVQNTAIPHGADVRLVRAYDKVEDTKTEAERNQAIEEMEGLKETRQDLFVRWTMDRHLREVRSFPAKTVEWPDRKDFVVMDEPGRRRMQWAGYGRHVGRLPVLLSIFIAEFGIRTSLVPHDPISVSLRQCRSCLSGRNVTVASMLVPSVWRLLRQRKPSTPASKDSCSHRRLCRKHS